MIFQIGQKVTCIDASNFNAKNGERVPNLYGKYTVRSKFGECIRLKEIINTPQQYQDGYMECSFKPERFILTPKGRK